MRNKYKARKDYRAYVIDKINDQEVRIVTKLMTINIVRKNRPQERTSEVIALAE